MKTVAIIAESLKTPYKTQFSSYSNVTHHMENKIQEVSCYVMLLCVKWLCILHEKFFTKRFRESSQNEFVVYALFCPTTFWFCFEHFKTISVYNIGKKISENTEFLCNGKTRRATGADNPAKYRPSCSNIFQRLPRNVNVLHHLIKIEFRAN